MKNRNKILVIEDDESLRWGLQHHLEKHGFHVLTAEDGAEGLDLADDMDAPDLILLDLMIPIKSGYDVCAELRRSGHSMPIIMLTAKNTEFDIVRGLELGANDYVTKPFSINVLIARIEAFLRASGNPLTSEFLFGDYLLDIESHRLSKHSKEIELTRKEFGVLEFLLKNQGRALTRGQVLREVWGSTLAVSARSVDRCITTLRSKIEIDPKHPKWVQTIRDVGYRFEP